MNYDEILCRRIQEVKPSGIRRFFDILEEMASFISSRTVSYTHLRAHET